ncbi:unnamed protein product [Amaranthus hypochondriacus]
MKNIKLKIQEMGIDMNDVKILINSCFQYLIKTCYQWAKDHPLVSFVLLFFYVLYILFPYVFNLLFYTFPLVVCLAILIGGPRFRLDKQENPNNKDSSKTKTTCDFTSIFDQNNRRPYLQTQMSRRTFGKTNKNNTDNTTTTQVFRKGISPNHSDTESQSDEEDDQTQNLKKNKLVVEWTEDDQRNLMELGSLELERNKRLESLIAKRKARKLLSMQPRRPHFYPFDDQNDDSLVVGVGVGPIVLSKGKGVIDELNFNEVENDHNHQPGSAPSVLLPTSRNPFDLPYDPLEEKPVLTGGSFDDDFFMSEEHAKDRSMTHDLEDPVGKSVYGFLTKPRSVSDKPGFTRFRRESDAEEKFKEMLEQLTFNKEENQQTIHLWEELPPKVTITPIQDLEGNNNKKNNEDETLSSQPLEDEESQKFENPFAVHTETIDSDNHFISPPKKDQTQISNHEEEDDNCFDIDSEQITSPRHDDEAQSSQHHADYKEGDNGNDDEEESSCSSSNSEVVNGFNVHKNEAFRNSVRKVLTCLAFPRNTGIVIKDNTISLPNAQTRQLFTTETTTSTNVLPTKMQERSYYTNPHHTSNFSIASDMQVEVSEAGSPTLAASCSAVDPTSPNSSSTDQESYDGDVDKDANYSGDDDELWGASPHPTKLGEFGLSFKLQNEAIHKEASTSLTTLDNVVGGDVVNHRLPLTLMEEQERHPEVDQVEVEGEGKVSPTSILPDSNPLKSRIVVDLRSVDGEIVESRSSLSSSSESLTNQMQSKAEHIAEFLASLPPTESATNVFEEGEPSHVRESSSVESIQDEMNPNFEVNKKYKDEQEERNHDLEGSHGSSEGSTIITNQIEAPKEITSSSSNDFNARELNKVFHDQSSSISEPYEFHLRSFEDRDKDVGNENEVNSSPIEAISDSFSTTSQENNSDQSRLEELKSQSQIQIEDDPLNHQIFHDDECTTYEENAKADVDHVMHHSSNIEGDDKEEETPDLETIKHENVVQLGLSKTI